MIFLIGGAPRAGKSILCQQVAAKVGSGWDSTDLLMEILRVNGAEGIKTKWDASPAAIRSAAQVLTSGA